MHMIIGFVLASLLRKKKGSVYKLPSIPSKLEVAHSLPGRMRLISPLLEGVNGDTQNRISAEMKKIEGIGGADINSQTGSLLIVYDDVKVHQFIVHGMAVRLLGLEKVFEESPEGMIMNELRVISRSVSQQIHQSSGGYMDLNSSVMMSILTFALYRIFIQGDRSLPGGINLLWWSFVLAQKKR